MEMDIKNRFLLPIIDILVTIFLLSCMIYFIVNARASGLSYPVSDNWTVGITGDDGYVGLSDVNIDKYKLTKEVGTIRHIELSRKFSGQELESATLRIYLMTAEADVYIGDERIFSSVDGYMGEFDRGKGYAFVEIPHMEDGGKITIMVTGTDRRGLVVIPEIALTPSDRAFAQFIHEGWLGILISIFILVFGIVLSVVSLIFMRLNKDYTKLFDLGVFSSLAGVWLISNTSVPLRFGMAPERFSTMG